MIGNLLRAGAMALALLSSPAGTQQFGTTTAVVANRYIEKIQCDGGSGTGFKLATGQWVSANHVTSLGGCVVDGIPIIVSEYDELRDYSIFTVPGDKRRGGLTVDCGGYKEGWVHGQGHARGLPIVTSVPVLFSRYMNERANPRHWVTLIYNRFIPGQSGGPVLQNDGRVVGLVNAFAIFFPGSFSLPMSETKLCS